MATLDQIRQQLLELQRWRTTSPSKEDVVRLQQIIDDYIADTNDRLSAIEERLSQLELLNE